MPELVGDRVLEEERRNGGIKRKWRRGMRQIIVTLAIGLLIIGCAGGKKYPNVVETREMLGWRTGYDANGNEIYQSKIDDNGDPELDSVGTHTYEWTYENGNRISESRFGINGEPVSDSDGIHRAEWKNDPRGNIISEKYFDLDNEPTELWGHHEERSEWDARDNRISVSYFGSDGKPSVLEDLIEGKDCHRWERGFDENDNRLYDTYYDIDGVLIKTVEYKTKHP